MKILTLVRLKKMNACSDALIDFEEKFNSKAQISKVYHELTQPKPEWILKECYQNWLVWLLGQGKALTTALLEQGADVNATDEDGWTPLRWAVGKNNIEVAKFLLEQGADIHATNGNGWTLLSVTVHEDNIEMAKLLLKKGADVNIADEDGWTPIKWARGRENTEMVELLKSKGAK